MHCAFGQRACSWICDDNIHAIRTSQSSLSLPCDYTYHPTTSVTACVHSFRACVRFVVVGVLHSLCVLGVSPCSVCVRAVLPQYISGCRLIIRRVLCVCRYTSTCAVHRLVIAAVCSFGAPLQSGISAQLIWYYSKYVCMIENHQPDFISDILLRWDISKISRLLISRIIINIIIVRLWRKFFNSIWLRTNPIAIVGNIVLPSRLCFGMQRKPTTKFFTFFTFLPNQIDPTFWHLRILSVS